MATITNMFDKAIPALLAAQRARCAQIGGTYGFDLFGDGGGAWTLDFAAATVTKGIAPKATLTLSLPAADFERMMNGSLDVTEAIKEGRLRIGGDAKRLTDLLSVLTGASA
jgi:alkyl sulfatase BDS1-like metallo-beta-lactamase superfamily hydrolase